MKYIHIVIGMAIIVFGASILSITINNEIVKNIMLKIIGFGVFICRCILS